MDEMDLEGTPAQQPEDPFKGDESVSGETVQTEQTVSEQPAAEQPAAAEAQPAEAQPAAEQPAAEAVAVEKPKWQQIIGKITPILIAVAGILAALFMCLLSYKFASYDGDATKSYMLKDVSDEINKYSELLANIADSASTSYLASILGAILFDAYIAMAMVMGIITGLICGIMLIVKSIKQFAMKKQTTLEKTAITSCLFFFADAAILLSVAMNYVKYDSEVAGIDQYGAATLAGLIIVGILFGAYFVGKIAANYQQYFGNKTKLINGCMNLAWAVIAMLVLALLTCAPVIASEDGYTMAYGFSNIFSSAFANVLKAAEGASDEVLAEYAKQYMLSAVGMVIQIWFIFQSGKSLHGAMRGTVAADKAAKLGSQIWRLVFAVLYLIICASLANTFLGEDAPIKLAAPIVILVFSIIGLVIAIVNKVLVKEKASKKEI